jgi:hydrogenase nickel incorporation protein HypB
MCTVCGCSAQSAQAPTHSHSHGHDAPHIHAPSATATDGFPDTRLIEVETDILAHNNRFAAQNRQSLAALRAFAVNMVSSPGSGKTTLLCKTIEALADQPLAVIEGDQQTTRDADRIRATGAPAVQVNTGKGCHLDARMVARALNDLPLARSSMLFIENVGNLVCPAAFDLGEHCKVTVLSVTEGEDKPLKYPDIFTATRLAILSKIDLAPYCDVDLGLFHRNLARVNPDIEVIRLSARTGEGMSDWITWLKRRLADVAQPETQEV